MIWVVDKPDRTQVQMRLASMGPDGRADAVDAFWWGVVAFGGTFCSPFCQTIRDQHGWSYVAHATFDRHSPWAAPVVLISAPAIDDAIDCLAVEWELFDAFRQGELPGETLQVARDYLLGRHPFTLASAHDMLGPAAANELLGLPPQRFVDDAIRLEGIAPEQVGLALQRYLAGRQRRVTMVGPADRLISGLQQRFPSIPVRVVDFRAGLDVCQAL